MKFQKGAEVVWLHNGEEIPATVSANGKTHEGREVYQIEVAGQTKHVGAAELLAPKKPGFEIRDLAFVLTENRDAVQGEVIAVGIGPKDQKFFQMKFAPDFGIAQSWYSEDEVFIISNPKAKPKPKVSVL